VCDPPFFIILNCEAAADMFLNWVYRKITDVGLGTWQGFQNRLWRGGSCFPNGCNDPGNSGNVRFTWMNATLNSIFSDFGW
jgi:hypothetical protein